jgi:hypothetical protein
MNGRRIVLEIDDNSNADALIKYIKSLDYVRIEEDDFDITEWQKMEVRKRLKDYQANPTDVLDFDNMMDEIEKEL